jgi:RHS repeat-associated protein
MARFAVGQFLRVPSSTLSLSVSPATLIPAGFRERFAAFFALVLLLAIPAFSQGVQPFSTQMPGPDSASVDLASGNIVLSIPIRSKAGKIPFVYSLISGFPATGVGGNIPVGQLSRYGLTWGVQHSTTTSNACGSGSTQKWSGFSFTDSSGAMHIFPITDSVLVGNSACGGSFADKASDGTGYTLAAQGGASLTWTLYDRSGNYVNSSSSLAIEDPDGASIGESWGLNTVTYTDTLGETVLSGAFTRPTPSSDTYSYTDASGNNQTYTVSYTEHNFKTNFGCGHDQSASNVYYATSISTPTGAAYTIAYEQTPNGNGFTNNGTYYTGRITKITLPSGGYVSYGYSGGNNGLNCNSNVVPTLTRTINDNNGNNGTWTYVNSNNSSTPGNFTVTVTDPGSNQTVYSFAGEYQTQAVFNQGTSTVLKTVTTCYNGTAFASCVAPGTVPALPFTQTDVYTSLGTSSTNRVTTTFDSYGNVTSMLAYDFGASTPTSQTLLFYGQSWNGTNACNPYPSGTYIFNTPCYSHTENSAGTDLAKTKIAYSNSGHPTSSSRWVSGSNWLTSSATFNSNGTLASVTDVNGAVTSFSNFACNGMFAQTTTLPTVTVAMSTSATFDCNGGVAASSTDVNGNVTTFSYTANGADPLYRIKSVTDPDGGVVSSSYSTGSSLPWTTTASTARSSGSSTISSTATLDGLGRTVSTQSTDPNASGGYKYGKTVFNSLGQAVKVYNPYFTTSDPTYGYASFTYDALGRTIQITNPDSTYRTLSYTKRATEVTDESGITKVYQGDGLGRLVNVCDGVGTTGTLANGASATACGLDISANGFLATYNYDALSNLTSINFSGQGRQFAYDGLSRMLTENEPEIPFASCGGGSYSKCYTYDSVTPGDLYSATFLNPGGTVVSAIYSWDKLHRLSTLEYSDGSNGYGYAYDASMWLSWSLSNGKGRLTSQSHSNGAAAAYSYDVMGRPVWEASCAGANCYSNVRGILHAYDYAGDVTAVTDSYTGQITRTLNSVGQVTGVTSAWSDSTHPATLLSYATYNPLGELAGATYGDSLVQTNTYDTLGRLTQRQDGSGPTYNLLLGYNANSTISSYQDNVTGTWAYTYDAFNRLATANLTQTGNNSPPHYSYSYDQYGNRWQQHKVSGTGYEVDYTFNAYNKNSSFYYDDMGNVIGDGICPTSPYCWSYDYAGQLTTGNGASYLYDALGRRQQKTEAGGTVRDFVFDANSPFTEYTPSFTRATGGFFTYANGTTYFNRTDNLGTRRLSTDYTGAVACEEGVLMGPFGDGFSETCNPPIDFTGFAGGFWDSENNGDHFGAREYQKTHGSWLSPDPAGLAAVDITNPQTWNRYSYVGNNPVTYNDPLGLQRAKCGSPANQNCKDGDASSVGVSGGTGANWNQFGLMGIPVVVGYSWGPLPEQSWISPINGGNVSYTILGEWGWSPIYSGSGFTLFGSIDTAWLGSFATNLFSVKSLKSPFESFVNPKGCNRLLKNTLLQGFSPFPSDPSDTPGSSEAVEPATRFLSAVSYNQALNYAATNGLTYPLKSSVFRGLLDLSEGIEASAPAATVILASGNAVVTTVTAAISGDCQ